MPVPFWCYFLPMAAASLGWIPHSHPAYDFLSRHLLPVCLVLLLIGTNLPALRRLGPRATLLMLVGAIGTALGGLVSFTLFRGWLPDGAWGGVAALTGSWIGGSANLLAVKEALAVPDTLIGPIILVDAAIAYSWMALLIAGAAWQSQWDQFLERCHPRAGSPGPRRSRNPSEVAPGPLTSRGPSQTGLLTRRPASTAALGLTLPHTFAGNPQNSPGTASDVCTHEQRCGDHARSASRRRGPGIPVAWVPAPFKDPLTLIAAILVAVASSLLAQKAAHRMPLLGPGFTPATWTILLVTSAALLLSATPVRRIATAGASRLGTLALYVLLVSIGARGNLAAVFDAPVFFALGLVWIAIHGLCLLAAGYLLKAPLGLIATASQANIGGPISAPIVGATFSALLAEAGLLMAILGNLLGTYAGLGAGLLARWLAPG